MSYSSHYLVNTKCRSKEIQETLVVIHTTDGYLYYTSAVSNLFISKANFRFFRTYVAHGINFNLLLLILTHIIIVKYHVKLSKLIGRK